MTVRDANTDWRANSSSTHRHSSGFLACVRFSRRFILHYKWMHFRSLLGLWNRYMMPSGNLIPHLLANLMNLKTLVMYSLSFGNNSEETQELVMAGLELYMLKRANQQQRRMQKYIHKHQPRPIQNAWVRGSRQNICLLQSRRRREMKSQA